MREASKRLQHLHFRYIISEKHPVTFLTTIKIKVANERASSDCQFYGACKADYGKQPSGPLGNLTIVISEPRFNLSSVDASQVRRQVFSQHQSCHLGIFCCIVPLVEECGIAD
ncbi:hypothetical protein GJAV_G00184210 [Gymnothorax javanicus]|nr:hypothetical protein GJAV_G00184210 [Gymnothorax javanicus]